MSGVIMSQSRRLKSGDRPYTIISKFPFYYGWIILIVGSLGVIASVPGQTMGVSVFTDHIMEALGLSRVGISSAYMIGTLASSLIIPYAGILYDRWGARITASIAAFFLSVFLLLLANSPTVSSLITGVLGVGTTAIAFVVVVVGFFGIRFFGQGILTLVSRGMVARWFGPRRGLVVGIMGLLTSFGFSYAPQPLQSLITHFGWRGALILLAIILGCIFLPLVILTFRSDPSSCALEIEQGLSEPKKKRSSQSQDASVEKNVAEARRDPAYWVILGLLGYWALYNTAFTFHIVSIYSEVGLTASEAVKIFLPISVVTVLARFIGSYVSDRVSIKNIYIAFTIASMVSSASLMLLHSPIGRSLTIVSYGISTGLFGMLNIVTWPKLYGRKHLGAISGFAMSIVVAGSAVGPWFFSLAYRFTGSYGSAGFIGFLVASAFLVATIFIKFKQNTEPVLNSQT